MNGARGGGPSLNATVDPRARALNAAGADSFHRMLMETHDMPDMNRRGFLTATGAGLAGLASASGAAANRADGERPNARFARLGYNPL